MDFIKSNNKNRYVNFFANRNKQNNLKEEILLMNEVLGGDAKVPQIRPILSQTFKSMKPINSQLPEVRIT